MAKKKATVISYGVDSPKKVDWNIRDLDELSNRCDKISKPDGMNMARCGKT